MGHILGRKIGYGFPPQRAKEEQPGIERFWEDPEFNPAGITFSATDRNCFVPGIDYTAIEHKQLVRFQHKFSRIGEIKINPGFKSSGAFGYAENFNEFESRVIRDSIGGTRKIPLDRIIVEA